MADSSLSHPPFSAGDLVQLDTAGGAFAPVRLHGVGVEPLTIPDDTWLVPSEGDLTISWNPPASPGRGEVHMRMNIDQHGVSPILLECTFEDTGSGTIPEALLQALIQSGVSGFPNGRITRRTVDSTTLGDGCMDFTVATASIPTVRVSGFTP